MPHANILAHYLTADNVLWSLEVGGRQQALEAVALHAAGTCAMNFSLLFRALWRREQSGSTALGHGIAIPHARIEALGSPIVMVARLATPIDFLAPDNKLVSWLLAILVPDQASEEHLQILACASEMFSDAGFCARLNGAADARAVFDLVTHWAPANR